ncbi:MAG: hypothetical protein WCL30_03860, partial [Pseudomonadota bacterium]
RQLYNVKRWAYQYAMITANNNPNSNKNIIIVDGEDFWVDATSATGDPKTLMTSDGLHWSQASAQAMGLQLAGQLAPLLGVDGKPSANIVSQADAYDATYNPDGAVNFAWLMNATPGTPTAPLTGNIAGNFNAFRASGSATGTLAASVETTRSDGLSGNRQVFTFSLGVGTNAERFSFGITNSLISAYNINVGDKIIAECDMWLSGHANVNILLLELNFTQAGSVVAQAYDGDTTRSTLLAAANYMALAGDSTPMTLRTPSVTVPSGVSNFTCYATIGFDASGAAASATATWKIGNFKIRKSV